MTDFLDPDFLMSGAAIDWILALVAAEAVLLWIFLRARGRPAWPILANLAAGAALMFAVKLALTGAPAVWIAGALGAAFVAHLSDLAARLTAPARQEETLP
jgi:hypothetical protein